MNPLLRTLVRRALVALTLTVGLTACTPAEIDAWNRYQTEQASQSPETIIRAVFDDNPDSAVGVAHCESGLDPGAVNGQFKGLFQIGLPMHADLWRAVTGQDWWATWSDPTFNAQVARALYDGSGWRPWACRWAA